jgi:hypothetical protein
MKPLDKLKELALQESRRRSPNFPEYARVIHKYTDKTANGLTKCILDFIKFNGGQAERISVTGRFIDNSKVVEDVIGRKRKIGSGQYIPSSMQKGSADISTIVNGRSVKWEIKIGKDRQSEEQKQYQQQVEKAGGYYFIVRDFAEFIEQYEQIAGLSR